MQKKAKGCKFYHLLTMLPLCPFFQDCEGNATFIHPEHVVLKLNESRIITSPNYPFTYPQNKRCYWRVRGDSSIRKFVIKVVFLHLQLESSTNCRKDSISFYEGSHFDQDWFLGTFCGTTHPEVLYTRKTNLWPLLGISSITGQGDQYRSFKLEFTLVPEGEYPLAKIVSECEAPPGPCNVTS